MALSDETANTDVLLAPASMMVEQLSHLQQGRGVGNQASHDLQKSTHCLVTSLAVLLCLGRMFVFEGFVSLVRSRKNKEYTVLLRQ